EAARADGGNAIVFGLVGIG
ncbi:hypothetical protein A2U01_0107109, partial [Trifolium medium]|nr:hypothetical protein [Trifolium medium]